MLTANTDSFWLRIIYIVSVLISGAIAFLILGPRPVGIEESLDVSFLPILNATLNGVTTALLIVGYSLIRQKKRQQHKNVMLSAFGTSTAFLISYVIYHWFKSGPKLYTGDWTALYYFILISHILLACLLYTSPSPRDRG